MEMKISCFNACGANGTTSQGFLLSDMRRGRVGRRWGFKQLPFCFGWRTQSPWDTAGIGQLQPPGDLGQDPG